MFLKLSYCRYIAFKNLIASKKKKIENLSIADLGVDITPQLQTLLVREPEARKPGVILASTAELVDRLKNEAKVL